MNEIINEVVESYNDYIQNVASGSQIIADTLRKDQIADAMHMILNFSEGMSWLTDASQLLEGNGVAVNLHIEKIHEFLNEINIGLENQDYVLVADMFEYEITPFFEQVQIIEGQTH